MLWSAPRTLSSIRLYDRPNSDDRITGGTLTFSDGSTVTVPSLNNAGSATTVTFSARSVTSVRLTVTSVSSTTTNVGLAEIQAMGYTTGATGSTTSALRVTPIRQATAADKPKPGSTPEQSRDAIGKAPVVMMGGAQRRSLTAQVPYALGTIIGVQADAAQLLAQPRAVASVAGGGDAPERTLQVDVRFSVEGDAAEYSAAMIAIEDADGTRYAADAKPGQHGNGPKPDTGIVNPGETVDAVAYFDVPSHAEALSIVLLGADGSVITSWSLSSH